MARIRQRDFSGGWWPVGPSSDIPRNALREAIGVRPFTGKAIKSRYGNANYVVVGAGIQSLIVWHGIIFFSTGGANAKFKSVGANNFVSNLLNNTTIGGGPLRFAEGLPTPEVDVTKFSGSDISHLFIVGLGLTREGLTYGTSIFPCRKLNITQESPMGFDPPPDDWSVGLQDPITPVTYDSFEIAGAWVPTNATATATTRSQVGTSALAVTVASDQRGHVESLLAANFGNVQTGFNGVRGLANSVKQDWIRLWVHVDQPANLDHIELLFDVGGPASVPVDRSTGWEKAFGYSIYVSDSVLDSAIKPKGVTDFEGASDRRDTKPPIPANPPRPTHNFSDVKDVADSVAVAMPDVESEHVVAEMATTKISPTSNTWTLLRIPKMLFEASNAKLLEDHPLAWSRIRRCRIVVVTNDKGSVVTTFDELDLHFGFGMQGDYKVCLTYRNSVTGTRSNPCAPKEVKGNLRQAIEINNVRFTGETGIYADQIELWRTLGNGNVFFHTNNIKIATLTNDSRIFDITSDYEGMQESRDIPGLGPTRYLQGLVLPQDNLRLSRKTYDICGPHLGRMFTLAWDQRGRVFYSPPGRLEVMAGFIEVTTDTAPIRRLVLWNTIYAFGEKNVYELQGNQEPFSFREIYGIPGCFLPETICASPFGIIYADADFAVRVFNGSSAPLVSPDAITAFFQGEASTFTTVLSATNMQATYGRFVLYGVYHEEEYFLSDGSKTVVVNMRTGVWRVLGVGLGPSYVEQTFGQLFAITNPTTSQGAISNIEISTEETDSGTPIPFLVEFPGTVVEDQSGTTKVIQRLYIEGDTASQDLSVALLTTSVDLVVVGTFNTNGRQRVEFPLCLVGDVIAVRLTGSLITPIEINEVAFDVHLPEEGGSTT